MRTLKATCSICGRRFGKRLDEDKAARAARLAEHQGSLGCIRVALVQKLHARGLVTLHHSHHFHESHHLLKAAGLLERHCTAPPGSKVPGESWGPRWARDYDQYLRSQERSFRERLHEIRELAAEPDGPDRARAWLVLRGGS